MVDPNSKYFKIVQASVPSRVMQSPDYLVLLQIIAYELQHNDGMISILDNAYDPEDVDLELLSRLADTLGIEYPIDRTNEELRFLLRYFRKLLRSRGTLKAIKNMCRVLSYTEEDLCKEYISVIDQLVIQNPADGVIRIVTNRLPEDIDFVKSMLRYVVDAGYEVAIQSNTYNQVYSSDSESTSTDELQGDVAKS